MRLAFHEADFGVKTLHDSIQFVFPSMVRLGLEANELIHKATNLNTGVEKITTFSSPKRYLWDNHTQDKEWEFVILPGENKENRLARIKGISEQLNADGSLNTEGGGSISKLYSRKALMTLSALEILAQANMQINSFDYRDAWGEVNRPRRIGRIVVTCPTAMSMVEQHSLRNSIEDAFIILDRFYSGKAKIKIDEREARNRVKIYPSTRRRGIDENHREWIYDEATCSQFVYLFAELAKRYNVKEYPANCKEYFDFYGSYREDLDDYNKKSLTIGSVDMGAGTTDIMVATYKYDDSGQCSLTPVPLYWESFYMAGDDMMKSLIRKFIIEGIYADLPLMLKEKGIEDISTKILDFFSKDNSRITIPQRQRRSEFNIQVSVPVIQHYLKLLGDKNIQTINLKYSDIFKGNEPTIQLQDYFFKHFGIKIEDIVWHFNRNLLEEDIRSNFEALIGQISAILSYYKCDVVLLAGRPMSLDVFTEMFIENYSVAPNRLISMSNYKIGTWYPFQDGKGYFKDSKSIVAIGAMIANYATIRGSIDGFSLDLTELGDNLKPTTDFFAKSEKEEPFITPDENKATIVASQLPLRIWTRQLDSIQYPTRPFYCLDYNTDIIKNKMKDKYQINESDTLGLSDATTAEYERIRQNTPYKFKIVRESFRDDKENLVLEEVIGQNGDVLPLKYFKLTVQSMSEDDGYWMDTGAFNSLKGKN